MDNRHSRAFASFGCNIRPRKLTRDAVCRLAGEIDDERKPKREDKENARLHWTAPGTKVKSAPPGRAPAEQGSLFLLDPIVGPDI